MLVSVKGLLLQASSACLCYIYALDATQYPYSSSRSFRRFIELLTSSSALNATTTVNVALSKLRPGTLLSSEGTSTLTQMPHGTILRSTQRGRQAVECTCVPDQQNLASTY